jgi:Cu+-exporting ATPase
MFEMQIMEHAHNFEISAALITIILLGKYIETISKKKTVDKLAELASLKVTKANLVELKMNESISLDCKDREIPVELVEINDLLKVAPGQGIPVDGVVLYGRGFCNEAMLTGESKPIIKEIGAKVYGGSILGQGSVIMRVVRTSENSSINQIIKLVENA